SLCACNVLVAWRREERIPSHISCLRTRRHVFLSKDAKACLFSNNFQELMCKLLGHSRSPCNLPCAQPGRGGKSINVLFPFSRAEAKPVHVLLDEGCLS